MGISGSLLATKGREGTWNWVADKPNYIIFMLCTTNTRVTQVKYEFTTIKKKKEFEDDSANVTITISHGLCAILYMASNNRILLSL